MNETEIQRNLRLCGRRRIPRSHRRVMLALLSGAGNTGAYSLGRAAQTGIGTVYVVLAGMEGRGMVQREKRDVPGREYPLFRYRLTLAGQQAVMELFGLREYDPGEQWEHAPTIMGDTIKRERGNHHE